MSCANQNYTAARPAEFVGSSWRAHNARAAEFFYILGYAYDFRSFPSRLRRISAKAWASLNADSGGNGLGALGRTGAVMPTTAGMSLPASALMLSVAVLG